MEFVLMVFAVITAYIAIYLPVAIKFDKVLVDFYYYPWVWHFNLWGFFTFGFKVFL